MKENEVERLIQSYGNSFEPINRSVKQKQHSRWRKPLTFGLVAATGMTMFVLVMIPRNATARTIESIQHAISDANSMEVFSSMKLPSGWRPYLHIYYANNMWRHEAQMGTGVERTIIMRDGMVLQDRAADDFAILYPKDPSTDQMFDGVGQTALDFAKGMINSGSSENPKQITIHEHSPINGRDTYAVHLDNEIEHYHAEILVDQETNLPFQSDMQTDDGRPNFKGLRQAIHVEYKFNQKLSPDLFALNSKKRIIKSDEAMKSIAKMWAVPLSHVRDTEIRDVTITSDGTVWIAFTEAHKEPKVTLPSTLTDNLGTTYVRTLDLNPKMSNGSFAFSVMDDKSVCIVGFVPLMTHTTIPSQVQVGFAKSQSDRNWGIASKQVEVVDQTLSFTPLHSSNELPEYFPLLGMGTSQFQFKSMIWNSRAKALEDRKDWLHAAQAYDEYAKARYRWVKYSAFEPMLKEAFCYRQLGQIARADEITKQAEALKNSMER